MAARMKAGMLVIISIITFISCQTKEGAKPESKKDIPDTTGKNISKKDTIQVEKPSFDALKYIYLVDSLRDHGKLHEVSYAWVEEPPKVFKIVNDDFVADETFAIFKNDTGLIVAISCFPISQSGDWFEFTEYIFDPAGRTLSYNFHHSTFVSECGEARITITRHFDTTFALLNENKLQTKFDKQPITNMDCFSYLKFEAAKNIEALAKRPGLGKAIQLAGKPK